MIRADRELPLEMVACRSLEIAWTVFCPIWDKKLSMQFYKNRKTGALASLKNSVVRPTGGASDFLYANGQRRLQPEGLPEGSRSLRAAIPPEECKEIVSHPERMAEIVVRTSLSGTPDRAATLCAAFRWSPLRCDHRLMSGIVPRSLKASSSRLRLQKLRCAPPAATDNFELERRGWVWV